MNDQLSTFLFLTPLWSAGVVALAFASRWRGLARPLWDAERVDGTVVAHEGWTSGSGRELTGIVVDFTTADGRAGRLVEPPVPWERVPAIGSVVALSHRDDLTFTKRWSRRRQALAWVTTVVAMSVVVIFLQLFPLLMGLVIVPHIGWLMFRRWCPAPPPTRTPADLSFSPGVRFDPSSVPVPTAPPPMPDHGRAGDDVGEHEQETVADLVHRHFFAVVSAGVIFIVALISGSRSTDPYALGLHVGLAAVLMAGIVVFETSLALRGGAVVTGQVVDHVHRRFAEGDVCWLEVVEFPTDRGSLVFLDSFGPRRQRSVGAPVTVSFRKSEPERARALQRSQSLLSTVLIAGAVGAGLFVAAETWLPVLIQAVVCYVGFIAIDLVRGTASKTVRLESA